MAKAILEGEFESTGVSKEIGFAGKANITISGGIGQIVLEKSFDKEEYFPVTPVPFRVSDNTPLNGSIEEHENSVYYRFSCPEHVSGKIYYRIGQASTLR
jgi:hypothetical protein